MTSTTSVERIDPADEREIIERSHRRLISFATDAAEHAAEIGDSALSQMINDLHADLLDIAGDDD